MRGYVLPLLCAAHVVEGCSDVSGGEPCVEPRLELWCFHSESDNGPVVPDTGDAACETPSVAGSEPCGDYDVVGSGPDLSGVDHYFLDGVHVATSYWTDINTYCGGFVFWYGEKIACP